MSRNFPALLGMLLFLNGCDVKEQQNVENLKKIHKGMRHTDVISVMGSPDYFWTPPLDSISFCFVYNAPTGYSDNLYVCMNKLDSVVVKIIEGH